jgi:hypothetical protein
MKNNIKIVVMVNFTCVFLDYEKFTKGLIR